MLNHISIGVRDILKTKRFKDAALAPDLPTAASRAGSPLSRHGTSAVSLLPSLPFGSNAPWVRTHDAESAHDVKFFSALQEPVAYVRISRRNQGSRR
jgi:hypothetical protein